MCHFKQYSAIVPPCRSLLSKTSESCQHRMAIDTSAADHGLAAIFRHVRLDDDLSVLINLLTNPTGPTRWQTTEDFYHFISSESPDLSFERILNNFEGFAEPTAGQANHRRERALGKLRQAYRTAARLCAALDELPADQGEDLEAPLAPGTVQDLKVKWESRYHLKVRKEYNPCPRNVAQYFRMCKNPQSWTFVDLDKHTPTDGKKLISGPQLLGIQCQYDQMRIMAYAVSKGGNFTMNCSVLGPGTIMAPLDVNLNYADDALHRALRMKNPQWMLERDRETRTLMIVYIQEGMSQGEALRRAWKDSNFEWKDATMEKDIGKSVPSRNPGAARDRSPLQRRKRKASRSPSSSTPPRRKRKNKDKKRKDDPPKKKKGKKKEAKDPKHKFVTTRKGDGSKVCVNWEKGNCSKGSDCPDLHGWCNRKLKSGGVCGENHPGAKCTNEDRIR